MIMLPLSQRVHQKALPIILKEESMANSDSSNTVQSVVIMLIQRITMIYLLWLGLVYSHLMFLNCPNDLLIHLSITKFLTPARKSDSVISRFLMNRFNENRHSNIFPSFMNAGIFTCLIPFLL